jgi:cyclopropane-fatty-acyl-phospholipid synthase
VDGDWDTPDRSATLEFFARNEAALGDDFRGGLPARMVRRLYLLTRTNTPRGSRRNIAAHYDLGNDFYEAWLGPGMTYSCAIVEGGEAPTLEAAQTDKYRRLCERFAVEPGHHALEIRCDWGGFAEYVAKAVGCRVTGITVSKEQHDHARRRIYMARLVPSGCPSTFATIAMSPVDTTVWHRSRCSRRSASATGRPSLGS